MSLTLGNISIQSSNVFSGYSGFKTYECKMCGSKIAKNIKYEILPIMMLITIEWAQCIRSEKPPGTSLNKLF